MKRGLLCIAVLLLSIPLLAQTARQADSLLSIYASDNKFNGVALVAQKGKIVLEKGYGYKNAQEKTPIDGNTVFQVGSITKQFTAAVILQLQQEKKLSVQDKISKYFPQFPNGDRITIEHLLSHTSGIFNYTNDTVLMKSDVTQARSEWEMIALFKDRALNFQPGTSWEYSNSGYQLLGYIIQKVTGKPYEQVMRERLLQPLGMTSSGFDFTHLQSANKAKGYFSLGRGGSVPSPVVDSTIAYSAGALYASANDLYKWERAINSNKVLTPLSWKAAFTPIRNKYGYGWTIDTAFGRVSMGQSGGIHGFTSYLMRIPQDDLAIILISNASSPNLGKVARTIAAIMLEQPFQMPAVTKEITMNTASLAKFAGVYELAPAFVITISVRDGRIYGAPTNQPELELFAKSPNRFFLKAVEAEIEFGMDENGKVTILTLFQNGRELKGPRIR